MATAESEAETVWSYRVESCVSALFATWTKRQARQRELLVEPSINAGWALDLRRDTLDSGRVFPAPR